MLPVHRHLQQRIEAMGDYTQHSLTLADGVELAYRRYGPAESTLTPVLCLAGLTRNCRDFHDLAAVLSNDRIVIAPDMRGRGLSGYAEDISTYSVPQELADVFALLDALDLPPVTLVGTSRGGLLAMSIAMLAPQRMAGCVLNDIGPQVETAGLARIMSYVGKSTPPTTWAEATAQTKALNEAQFPNLTDEEWRAVAGNLFSETEDGLKLDYDPRIADAIAAQSQSGELVDMWPLFNALQDIPTLCVRGVNSDILSAAGLAAMAKAKPDMAQITVPERGHAPFLTEAPALSAIHDLLRIVDG